LKGQEDFELLRSVENRFGSKTMELACIVGPGLDIAWIVGLGLGTAWFDM
jgi:hypothetical protein